MLTISQIGAILSLLIAFNVPVGTVKDVEGILMAPYRAPVQQVVVQAPTPTPDVVVPVPVGDTLTVTNPPVFEYHAPMVSDVNGNTFKIYGENVGNITITKMVALFNPGVITLKGGGATFSGAHTVNLVGSITIAKDSVVTFTASIEGVQTVKITQIHGFYSDGTEFTSVVGLPVELQVP